MDANVLYFASILVFFIGWLIKHVRVWGDYIAIAGASLFVLVFILRALHVV